jgi:hypothetical protein
LILLDQDTINVVCNKKLGFFPSYFISYGICDLNYLNMINKENLNNNRIQDLKELIYFISFKIYTKPWYGFAKKRKFYLLWFYPRLYEYARKTSIYYKLLI